MMSEASELLKGTFDLHIHAGPDITARALDAYQASEEASGAGMGGILLKSKRYVSYPLAWAVQRHFPELHVFGGIVLDFEGGGLCVAAVETAAQMGAKICWLPCFSAAHDMKKRNVPGEGIRVVGSDGALVPEVKEILRIAKEHDMAIGTGHLSFEEMSTVIDAASEMGFDKVIATHVSEECVGATPTIEQQVQLADKGAIMEHCYCTLFPEVISGLVGYSGEYKSYDIDTMVEAIRAVGPERCMISTDCGNAYVPMPVEGMRAFIQVLLEKGITPDEIGVMARRNPARLMGLE